MSCCVGGGSGVEGVDGGAAAAPAGVDASNWRGVMSHRLNMRSTCVREGGGHSRTGERVPTQEQQQLTMMLMLHDALPDSRGKQQASKLADCGKAGRQV